MFCLCVSVTEVFNTKTSAKLTLKDCVLVLFLELINKLAVTSVFELAVAVPT